jgi:hypothetical protein
LLLLGGWQPLWHLRRWLRRRLLGLSYIGVKTVALALLMGRMIIGGVIELRHILADGEVELRRLQLWTRLRLQLCIKLGLQRRVHLRLQLLALLLFLLLLLLQQKQQLLRPRRETWLQSLPSVILLLLLLDLLLLGPLLALFWMLR